MTTVFNHKSTPNPSKLIESLRCLGYDNYYAIADLVDNSLDANAKKIKILVRTRNKEPEIIIADDGSGMDANILDQAIRLGSLIDKDSSSDLGKFGMGLCTASLSICKQTIVLTKTQDGELLKAINDVDEVKRLNDFISFMGKPDNDDKALFAELLGQSVSGTVVVLRKCDYLQNHNLNLFSNTLGKHLSRIFRYFIAAERSFFVNDKKLLKSDPLEWDNPATHYSDEPLQIKIQDGDRTIEDIIRIKLAVLPENPAAGERDKVLNIRNQGFYVLRNNREVLDSVELDLFTKHNSLNRFRGEILFSGGLDKYMGVNFTKRNISMHQSIQDKLKEFVAGQIKTIRARFEKEQRVETPDDVAEVHRSVEQEIHKKSKLLMTPKAPKEQREKSSQPTEKKEKTDDPNRGREPRERQQPGGVAANCRFETAAMGEAGVIYDAGQQGRTIVIKWNSDHPFYRRFVLENVQEKRMVAAADFLVYSLACAELMLSDEETVELINNLRLQCPSICGRC